MRDAPPREPRERSDGDRGRAGHPGGRGSDASVVCAARAPGRERLDQQRRDQDQADAAGEGRESSPDGDVAPPVVPRCPERQDRQEEEQRLRVRREEEERGGEDRRHDDRPPRDAIPERLGRQCEQREQRAEEGEVRDQERGQQRVAGQHPRDRADGERVQGEERGAGIVSRPPVVREPEVPDRILPLGRVDRVVPPRRRGRGGSSGHVHRRERLDQVDRDDRQQRQTDARREEDGEARPQAVAESSGERSRVGHRSRERDRGSPPGGDGSAPAPRRPRTTGARPPGSPRRSRTSTAARPRSPSSRRRTRTV